MYKRTYAAGDTWYEWLKMGAGVYATYRVNGDGSTTSFDQYHSKGMAKKWVQDMNDRSATTGGVEKVFKMSEAEEFLTKATFDKMNKDDAGFPLCSVYREKVLPDESDLCSLCRSHSASVLQGNRWATLEQLNIKSSTPF